jgi:PAS domain S-box-containing protein
MMTASMERSPSRARLAAVLLTVAAFGSLGVLLTGDRVLLGVPSATLWIAVASLASAGLIRVRSTGWPASRAIVALLTLGAIGVLAWGLIQNDPATPSVAGGLGVVILVPLTLAGRGETRAHADARQRWQIRSDLALLTLGLLAIAYPFVRPADAGVAGSVTAFAGTAVAAAAVSILAGLWMWFPARAHALQALSVLPFAAWAVVWSSVAARGGEHPTGRIVADLLGFLAPLALAATLTLESHRDAEGARTPSGAIRSLAASVAPVVGCAALAVVAIVDDARGIAGLQTTLLIGGLAVAVVARIVTNQWDSTVEHDAARSALGRRDAALAEADLALERVRESNETLRRSEEHLRLVFDAAVDGFVELDAEGTIARANGAFARMVGLDRLAIEGQRWTSLVTAIEGAGEGFATLPGGGSATLRRSDGATLALESRVSDLPTTPPRRLVLIRDVTANKASEQTIRSLFQFLQDRDEDRTRLFRRTNAAIEHERNRIARDLHDGPVQGVSAASLSLEAALLMIRSGELEQGLEVLATLRRELANEADALRRLMAGLRPPVLEERGLLPAIREMLARFTEEQGVDGEFSGSLPSPLPDDLETLAYRVVQEALDNVARHAQATHVFVRLDGDQSAVRVEVEDDGVGFDTARTRDFLHEGRVGIASMRERVELASGTFAVRSSERRGTAIMATLPIDASVVVVGSSS